MARFTGPAILLFACIASAAHADESAARGVVDSPAEIAADEPRAEVFSLERAARYLDSTALEWQKRHACVSCHTMLPYMMCRGALKALSPPPAEVRQFFEDVAAGTREAMPDYSCDDVEGAVAIGVASALAINDRTTTGKLHPLTRQALDRMWTLQRKDGGWRWPFRDTPPLKTNDHYGVTLAAIAAGMAPDDYANTPRATTGLDGIRRFLTSTKPVSLHESTMLLWASVYIDGLVAADAKAEVLRRLMSAERPDGGWSLSSLVDNTLDASHVDSDRARQARARRPGYGSEFLVYMGRDKDYESSLASDGYGTGFTVFVARQAGLPADDVRLQRGIGWLKRNQRASGRWFTPSQSWHTQHLISNAGTGYAVLALEACGEARPPLQAGADLAK